MLTVLFHASRLHARYGSAKEGDVAGSGKVRELYVSLSAIE